MKKLTEDVISFEGKAFAASLLPRHGSGVVLVRGALHAGPWHAEPKNEPVADIAASLLDEGTTFHARESFRARLEEKGIKVNFWAEGRYAYFSVMATKNAIEDALALTFEALTAPLISEASVAEVIEREAAQLIHESESTRSAARRAFSRILFKEDSAGYIVSAKEERARTKRLTREDVLSFISSNYRGRIIIAAVGDIEAEKFEKMLVQNTKNWDQSHGASSRSVSLIESPERPLESFVSIPGKESVDVYMGSAVPMMPTDPLFPALRVATDLLGGGFSDHLVQAVRDRDGLTYGTYARVNGKENGTGLLFGIWAMFGNSLFKKGVAALNKELSVFLKMGITPERLREKIGEIEGRSAVLFSDHATALYEIFSGMLSTGNPKSADAYISQLHELDAKTVQTTAEKYLRIDAIAAAGAIDEKGNLL